MAADEDNRRREEIGKQRLREHESHELERRRDHGDKDVARDLDEIRREVHSLHHKFDAFLQLMKFEVVTPEDKVLMTASIARMKDIVAKAKALDEMTS